MAAASRRRPPAERDVVLRAGDVRHGIERYLSRSTRSRGGRGRAGGGRKNVQIISTWPDLQKIMSRETYHILA